VWTAWTGRLRNRRAPPPAGGWSDFFDVKSIITMLLSVDERKYEMFT
jgi:hypothetical protein